MSNYLSMPRFYFDFQEDAWFTFDDEGEDLPDIDAAKDAALGSLAEAIKDAAFTGGQPKDLSVRIRTAAGPALTLTASIGFKSPD